MDAFARLQRQLSTKPYLTATVTPKSRAVVVCSDDWFALNLLAQPNTQVVWLRSLSVDPAIVDYYLTALFTDSLQRQSAKRRLTIHIQTVEKLLNSPQQLKRLRNSWPKKVSGILMCTQVTPLEQRLAFALQIPIYGVDPSLFYLGTKSGARALFRTANLPMPFGREHVRSLDQIGQALLAIRKHDRSVNTAVLKLDYEYGTLGQATISLKALPRSKAALERYIRSRLRCSSPQLTAQQFLQRFTTEGGVVEEWLTISGCKTPTVQLLLQPDKSVQVVSIHEQTAQGVDFPARPNLRTVIIKRAEQLGRLLVKQQVVGYITLDFIAHKHQQRWYPYAVALHPRVTSLLWPYQLAQQLTHATTQSDGTLKRNKRPVYYVTDEQVALPSEGLNSPKALIQFIREIGLHFEHRSHSGIIVHQFERMGLDNTIGVTAIARTNQSAEQQLIILRRALARHLPKATQQRPVGQVNTDRLVRTFLKYVRIPSPSHQEAAVRATLREELVRLGVKTRVDKAGNLIGYVSGTGTAQLLCAHMDTVKPCERIRPVIRGNVIMTDGTSILGADDKAGIAAILETLYMLKASGQPHPPLELIFSTGEETFSDGASQLDFSQIKSPIGFVLDGEALDEIDYRSAYLADLVVTIQGRAAHSGVEPEKGISAIQIAAAAIRKMRLGRVDADTTANIGIMTGGSIRNAIPATVYLHGEARSFTQRKIEDQLERMQKALQDAAEEFGGLLELNSRVAVQGYTLSKTDPLIVYLQRQLKQFGYQPKLIASMGATDANAFIQHGIKTINVGTGGQNLHTVNECIAISDLVRTAQLVYRLCVDPYKLS